MPDTEILGGASAALAAHSKDGSAIGSTPASIATGNKWDSNDMSDSITKFAGQAQDSAERAAKATRDAAEDAVETLSKQGARAVDSATDFVNDRPVVAMAAAGIVGLILGALLARR